MTFNPLQQLPQEWKTTAVRTPGNVRGPDGNMQPTGPPHNVEGFLIAPKNLGETTDFASVSTNEANGYAGAEYEFTADDVITTPEDSILPGRWSVDGTPTRWPFGWALSLKTVRRS